MLSIKWLLSVERKCVKIQPFVSIRELQMFRTVISDGKVVFVHYPLSYTLPQNIFLVCSYSNLFPDPSVIFEKAVQK